MNTQPRLSQSHEHAPANDETRGRGWLLMLLAPVLCCGLPALVVLFAAATAIVRGLTLGALVAVIGLVLVFMWRRTRGSVKACDDRVDPASRKSGNPA